MEEIKPLPEEVTNAMPDKTLVLHEEGFDEYGKPLGELKLPIHRIEIMEHAGKKVEFVFSEIDNEEPKYELVIHVPKDIDVTAYNKIVRGYPK